MCSNCGDITHEFYECHEPITSYGIILIKNNLKDIDLCKILESNTENQELTMKINSDNDIYRFALLKGSLQFLIIQRKFSLGYLEFVRGKYNTEDIDSIIFLFQQMTQEEINKINTNDFNTLWNEIWHNNKVPSNKNSYAYKEYTNSSEKFNKLKNNKQYNLTFFVTNVKPSWNYTEWGFPKGKRNKNETDIECAIREFKEETNLTDDDFTIIKSYKPLVETFLGTNGKPYRHVYYIAVSNNNIDPVINCDNPSQANEIGNICYCSYDTINDYMFRPYHIERKKLITNLLIKICDIIINHETDNSNKIKKKVKKITKKK